MTSPLRSSGRHAAVRAPKAAPERRREPRHLRVVEAPARRGRRAALGFGVVAIVFGALLAAAVFQAMLVTGQNRLVETNREIAKVERSLQRHRAELAAAQAPASLAASAEAIGMVAPDGRDWVRPPVAAPEPATPDDVAGDPGDDVDDQPSIDSGGSELAAPIGPSGEVPQT